MTYEEIVGKLKKGEPLTAEEFIEFGKVTRPADRFNEVSQRAQTAEAVLKQKDEEIEKLKVSGTLETQKLQDQVNLQLRELSGKVETLATQNSELQKAKATTDRLLMVGNIARENVTGALVKNTKYLSSRLEELNVDIADPVKVADAMKILQEKEPEIFMIPVKSGAGVGSASSSGASKPTKPVKDWGSKEKVDYIKEHGVDKYNELRTKDEV